MRKTRVKMRVAKSKAPMSELQSGSIRWDSPSDFLKYLKSQRHAFSSKGFISLKKRNYTDMDWKLIVSHTQSLNACGSIHNYRTHKGGQAISIKLRPHNTREVKRKRFEPVPMNVPMTTPNERKALRFVRHNDNVIGSSDDLIDAFCDHKTTRIGKASWRMVFRSLVRNDLISPQGEKYRLTTTGEACVENETVQ